VKICVFAKPPVPGEVKTRLVPAFGPEGAAALARAFLLDTWEAVAKVPGVERLLASTGPLPPELGIDPARVWPQGEGDLGARLERVLRRAIQEGGAAIAIGADSPGMPLDRLRDAKVHLGDHDAVFGPSEDGGFYLLGLRRCPAGLLADLPWSVAATGGATEARLAAHGLSVHRLASWWDVDEPADVERLRRALDAGDLAAPHTAAALATLRPHG